MLQIYFYPCQFFDDLIYSSTLFARCEIVAFLLEVMYDKQKLLYVSVGLPMTVLGVTVRDCYVTNQA